MWQRTDFRTNLAVAERTLARFGADVVDREPAVAVRGRGMALGIDLGAAGGAERADLVQKQCFDAGLIVELSGRDDEVVKVLPPLTIDPARFGRGLEILHNALVATR